MKVQKALVSSEYRFFTLLTECLKYLYKYFFVESSYPTSNHPVPLERLLGSDFDQNLEKLRKQLNDQESKVIHLTALLSDTEKDLVKHIQMNSLLKEEIRRQQRSEEREKHAENLEYLKNVVFKVNYICY